MYKIGEFSKLSKTTVKTLRYYEKEGLLVPECVDKYTGYRYYSTGQLFDLAKIIALRQIGFSIDEIKKAVCGDLILFLNNKKNELEKNLSDTTEKLQIINYLLKEKSMEREVIKKELPEYVVYYKEGVLKKYADASGFILQSAKECLALNPDIKCVEPDYCFMSYLDGEYKEFDVKVRYSQAVEKAGKESDSIKFEKLKPMTAICMYHKGAYENFGESYGYILKWIEENGYKIIAPIRERYIDGVWNKENVNDYLTEIQVPVERV